jgi:transcriptional regulator with GAF, ATPase, and Fis domain
MDAPPEAAASSREHAPSSRPPAVAEVGTLEDIERAHILATLARTGWVIEGSGGAAKILDLHPNTLRSRMKKLGIERGRR